MAFYEILYVGKKKMICDNCGFEMSNKENFCPNCGMELSVPYSKSLKNKYIAGEYSDRHDNFNNYNKAESVVEKLEYSNKPKYVRDKPVKNEIRRDHPVNTEIQHDYHANPEYVEYETKKSGTSIFSALILFLILALLMGFVLGMIIFSSQSIPGLPHIGGI